MLAMLLQKFTTVMAPQRLQQRHPAGVLHAALLLLCLALLMRASVSSAYARPVPSEDNDNGYGNDNGHDLEVVRQPEEGGLRPQEVFPVEKVEQVFSVEKAESRVKAPGDKIVEECGSLPDSTTEPCEDGLNRRMLDDYGSPERNQDSHPAGPLP